MAFVPYGIGADATFRQFADILIQAGVVAPEKAAIARQAGDAADAEVAFSKVSIMVNLATMGEISTTESSITGGLVVGQGNKPGKFLIRAVGPGLTAFGVTNALSDPIMTAYKGQIEIYGNDDWFMNKDTVAEIRALESKVGAFPLAEGSYDAVIVLDLGPGSYTFIVKGNRKSTGVMLLEIYRVP